MEFKNSCFISFMHAEGLCDDSAKLLHETLKSYLSGALRNLNVFVDWECSQGGDFYNPIIAEGLCQSVCMVVIYFRSYFDEEKDYCCREFLAMKAIDEERRAMLKNYPDEANRSFIIPIVVGQLKYLPKIIADHKNRYDFRDYFLAPIHMVKKNREFKKQVREIADYILDRHEALRQINYEKKCQGFVLPDHDRAVEWMKINCQPPKLRVASEIITN